LIDDLLPVLDTSPLFLYDQNGVIWPLLYLKAIAKLSGSYSALRSSVCAPLHAAESKKNLTSKEPRLNLGPGPEGLDREHEALVREFLTPAYRAAEALHDPEIGPLDLARSLEEGIALKEVPRSVVYPRFQKYQVRSPVPRIIPWGADTGLMLEVTRSGEGMQIHSAIATVCEVCFLLSPTDRALLLPPA